MARAGPGTRFPFRECRCAAPFSSLRILASALVPWRLYGWQSASCLPCATTGSGVTGPGSPSPSSPAPAHAPPPPRATPGRPPIAEARRDIAYLLLTGRLTDGQMDTQTPPFHGMQLCNNAACRDSSGDKKDVHHQQRRVDSHIQLLGILRPTMLCVCTTVSLRSPITDREVSVPSSQEGKESVAQAGRKPTTIQHLTHPSVTPIRNFVNRASPVISFFFDSPSSGRRSPVRPSPLRRDKRWRVRVETQRLSRSTTAPAACFCNWNPFLQSTALSNCLPPAAAMETPSRPLAKHEACVAAALRSW